jgi:hypothetical protein
MRPYFSSYHLWAAKHFTKLATDLEKVAGRPAFDIQERAYVMSAVSSSVAFLEAAINEVFDDIVDRHDPYVGSLLANYKLLLGAVWSLGGAEKFSMLDKYQAALQCVNGATFDKGAQPYQNAMLLVRLRNRLVHARPETRESGYLDDLDRALIKKFSPHGRMAGMGNPYYADHCLSAGCADWSVLSALNFADEFFKRLGVKPNYQRVDFGPP